MGQFLAQDSGFGNRPVFVNREQWSDQLKTQDEQEEKDAHDLAGAPLRQPALEPGEQHPRQNDVHDRKGQQHERSPGKNAQPGNSNADVNSEQPQAGYGRGRIERAVCEANQKVQAIAKRETEKAGRLDVLGKRRCHQGKELPEQKYRPEQNSEPLRISL